MEKCVGGSAFPASRSWSGQVQESPPFPPARVSAHRPLLSACPFPPSRHQAAQLRGRAASLAVGRGPPRVSPVSGGSAANWIVKDDPSAQLSVSQAPATQGKLNADSGGGGYLLKLCARLRPQKSERTVALRWERSRGKEEPHRVPHRVLRRPLPCRPAHSPWPWGIWKSKRPDPLYHNAPWGCWAAELRVPWACRPMRAPLAEWSPWPGPAAHHGLSHSVIQASPIHSGYPAVCL